MARSRRTVRYLASRAGVTPDLALEFLIEARVNVKRVEDVIPKNWLHRAEIALDLAPPPKSLPPPPPPVSIAGKPTPAAPEPVREEPRGKQRKKARPTALRIVGRRQPLSYLSFSDGELIHWELVRDFSSSRDPIDPPGIRSNDLLHSALMRCQTSFGADLKYPTPPMAAAALLHSMVLNHPFHNGNKRSGLVSVLVFLDKNQWSLRADQDELFDFVLAVASHEIAKIPEGKQTYDADEEVMAIAEWIHRHCYPSRAPRPTLKFHDLRSILLGHGCTFERPRRAGNRINIVRGNLQTQIWCAGEGREVSADTIPKIRRDLHLDEEHGYDADLFYNAEERLPDFITKYRKTLERLAKT